MPRSRSRFSPSVSFRPGPKRDTFWIAAVLDGQQLVAASGTIMLTLLTAAQINDAELTNSTIVRTRGSIGVISDQSAAAEMGILAVGVKLQNERARAAGVASVPLPFSQPDQSWFVHELIPYGTQAIASPLQFERVVDSKGMRKVADADSLILVIQNVSSSFGARLTFGLHILIKV